jgi:mRNA interferase MazF
VSPRRGDLWLVDFGEPVGREQAGRRPAVVVSVDALNEGPAGVLLVVPITTARRDLPSHIEIDTPNSGLDRVSYAKCEDLKSVSDRRLVHRVGAVDPPAMDSIERVLRYLLGL